MQNKDEFLDNDFNLFRIIEILIKRKITVILTILACLLVGYFYVNQYPEDEYVVLKADIDLGNNWNKSFTTQLKHVHLYPNRSYTEEKAEISINTSSPIEYQTYNLYNLQLIEDKVVNISNYNLYERFAIFVNNKTFNKLILESKQFLALSENKKIEISQTLNLIQIEVISDDSYTKFDKIALMYKSDIANINEAKNNLIFIIETIEDLVRNSLITQLNVLLSNYTSNIGKEYLMNIQVIQKINQGTLFKLNEHLKVAKKLNIKKNTDIIFSDLNLSYYLKGYELIEKEIEILIEQMKRDSQKISDTDLENVAIKYLKDDINLLKSAGNDFQIISFNIDEHIEANVYTSTGIILLSFLIGIILSIFLLLTIENYSIYKKLKKIN